jgi:predicted AlkP superfamily pyrophosphatase or phosphodiesterase
MTSSLIEWGCMTRVGVFPARLFEVSMKKLGAVLLAVVLLAVAAPTAQPTAGPDIRLVLLIAVDQFRYDYLTRFRTEYTGGIKRLLTEGAVFTNANLEHYPTVTAIGHATMLSGATPSVSGIIGNDWFDRETGATVTSVSDATVKLIGSAKDLAASPRRLLVSTVGDELKMASREPKGAVNAPRVLSVSLKDRSAILSVGRGADAAYWWDTSTGSFVTSTYYMTEAPAWVRAFNERKLGDTHAGASWNALSAPATLLRQLPAERGAALYNAVYGSPFGNELLLDFAAELLGREQLGRRNATDLLAVSLSSNDSVGHTYGPDSPQVRDVAIRTDRAIGRLLNQVDKTVGLQRTLVAFTTDHGVAPVPESLRDRGLPGGRMTTKDLFEPMQQALATRFGAGKWLMATAGSSPYLNYELIDKLGLEAPEVRRVAAAAATRVAHVARVYTRDDLLRGAVPNDRIGSRVLRGFNAQRSGDLEIILEPYWMRQAQGTTHGTPYSYDAHIPLILMGLRVRPGEYSGHVALNDLAPTLATLLGIEIPAGSSGRVLTEALGPLTATPRRDRSVR